jgi:hypothetical protein
MVPNTEAGDSRHCRFGFVAGSWDDLPAGLGRGNRRTEGVLRVL